MDVIYHWAVYNEKEAPPHDLAVLLLTISVEQVCDQLPQPSEEAPTPEKELRSGRMAALLFS